MRPVVLRGAARAGLVAGIAIVYTTLVGMVERFATLAVIGTVVTFTWVLVLGISAGAGYVAVRPRVIAGERHEPDRSTSLLAGVVAGATCGGLVAVAMAITYAIGIDSVRRVFRAVSEATLAVLQFHLDPVVGTALLAAVLVAAGAAGAGVRTLHERVRRPVLVGAAVTLLMGLLWRIVPPALDQLGIPSAWLYSPRTLSLTPIGAAISFAAGAAATYLLHGRGLREVLMPHRRPARAAVGGDGEPHPLEGRFGRSQLILVASWLVIAAVVLALPYLVGPVVSRILGLVGIYLLLGVGLNIVVGFAGLLDLGYVAFFAVGAYFTAILTGGQRLTFQGLQPPAFGADLSFYVALPIVVIAAALIGIMIGAPVLRLRGDYLAIVTLGFGEIARVIFGSTWAEGLFGGALGMSGITDASIPGVDLQFQTNPQHFYYLVLTFVLLAIFVSWRLQASRIGRAWNAMREDEQVADAMGISTIRFKLLAFAIGGGVGSVGGALFAVSLGSLTIKSFQIIVSITALAIVILGGLGSIPGVVVGALVLIGLPGLLTQFEEYRLLIYGGALIAIMLLRPQGLIPNVRRSRELHEDERGQDEWAAGVAEELSENAPQPAGGELAT